MTKGRDVPTFDRRPYFAKFLALEELPDGDVELTVAGNRRKASSLEKALGHFLPGLENTTTLKAGATVLRELLRPSR